MAEKTKINVVSTKVPASKKIKQAFVGDATCKNVTDRLIFQYLIPGVRDAIGRTAHGLIDMVLGNITGGMCVLSGSPYNSNNRTNYSARFRPESSNKPRSTVYNSADDPINNIIVRERKDVNEILSQLDFQIDNYGFATLGDLYDLIGIMKGPSDHHYGWSSTENFGTRLVQDGYLLIVPKPKLIDD